MARIVMPGELLTLAKLESNQNQGEDYFNFAEIVKRVDAKAATLKS